MKKTLYLAFISIVLSALQVSAQTVQANVDDSKSKKILDAVSEDLKSYNSMKVDFTFTMENENENIKETKKGTFYMMGEKYKLDMGQQMVINNGNTVWKYIKEANEVQIDNASNQNEGQEMNPYRMLTSYNDKFKTRYIRKEKENGKVYQIIDLYPKKGGTSFFRARLKIDKTSSEVVSSTLSDRNGGEYTYKVDNFVKNASLTDSDFVFDKSKHPGVEVIDLR